MENLKELSSIEINNINGGGPIFEGIAWIMGFIDGYGHRYAASIETDWNDVDWEKMRAKFE